MDVVFEDDDYSIQNGSRNDAIHILNLDQSLLLLDALHQQLQTTVDVPLAITGLSL